MAIVDKIHDLTKKMTGQDGVGSDITTAINDLTAKWTQSAGKGSNIEESIANLSSNASSGGGGDFSTATLVIDTAQAHSGGFYLPVIDDSDDDPMIYLLNEGYNVAEHTTPNVALYRGVCWTSIESDSNLIVTTTGNVEADGEGGVWYLYITGDGTITVADGE